MKELDQVIRLAADYDITARAFQSAHETLKELLDGMKERAEREREQDKRRISELSNIVDDISRSAAVRKLYADELSRLRGKNYGPFPTELEAFQQEFDDATKAILDLTRLRSEMQKARTDARAALESLCDVPMKDPMANTRDNWLEGIKRRMSNFVRKEGMRNG